MKKQITTSHSKPKGKLANSVPKSTQFHPWRKANGSLKDYSMKNLVKNKSKM
jgi:hypothetical protein